MNGRVFVLAFAGLVLMAATAGRSWASPAEDEFAQAAQLTSNGAFENSVAHWKTAGELFEQEKNSSRQIDTAIRLASAYYTLGQTRLALVTLEQAQDLVLPEDKKHLAEIKAALGGIYILAPPPMKDHAMHGRWRGRRRRGDDIEGKHQACASGEGFGVRSNRAKQSGESL